MPVFETSWESDSLTLCPTDCAPLEVAVDAILHVLKQIGDVLSVLFARAQPQCDKLARTNDLCLVASCYWLCRFLISSCPAVIHCRCAPMSRRGWTGHRCSHPVGNLLGSAETPVIFANTVELLHRWTTFIFVQHAHHKHPSERAVSIFSSRSTRRFAGV